MTVTGVPAGYEVRPSSLNLEPGSRFEAEIAFFPALEARFDGVVTFSVDDGTDRAELGIDVRGEGIQRVMEVAEALDFGIVPVGETRILPLSLSSTADMAITFDVSIEGGTESFGSGSRVVELAAGEARTIDVSFTPSSRGDHAASLLLRPCESCQPVSVRLVGSGAEEDCGALCSLPTAICPAAPESIVVNTWTVLAGDAYSSIDSATTCRWLVITAPMGSAARAGTGCTPSFSPDLVGVYRFELVVTDALGNSGSCEHELTARPMDSLTVETFWDVAGDIDLHLLNEGLGDRQDPTSWFNPSSDCYFANCTNGNRPSPLWDDGHNMSPFLNVDVIEGTGPETIFLMAPSADHAYAIGVHNRSNRPAPVSVTTNVYCGGSLMQSAVVEFTEVKQFEVVGSVRLTGSGCSFTPDGTRWSGFH
ncbi:hypothetical protein [Vulgatibacter incomptus]|uniref:hypothetical protein n=1 Tax=Vulgatibacter incomptus TaxID=1391653 RepID=UPI0012FC550B|nr:hypothetical protein [Vulgatibacter incomptus]